MLRVRPQIHSTIADVPLTQQAIVFGAAVIDENKLTDVTRERIEAAALLYWQGRVRYLFISGDNRYDKQAEAMGKYAIARGVPESHVTIDPIGIDTHDSCRHFVGIQEQAVLVTQAFHLPRAMLMCERNGIEITGLAANRLGILESRGSDRLEIARIRTGRFLREAGLTWLYLLGIYDRLSNEAEQLEQDHQVSP